MKMEDRHAEPWVTLAIIGFFMLIVAPAIGQRWLGWLGLGLIALGICRIAFALLGAWHEDRRGQRKTGKRQGR